jgi:indole-3-acetate monooxygenase
MWVTRSIPGGGKLDPVSSLRSSNTSPTAIHPPAGYLMAAPLGAACLDDAAMSEMFNEQLPEIAGWGTRPGIAVPQAGGFSLSGAWSFACGIKHATHIHTLGLVQGINETRTFLFPAGEAALVENWNVLGVRATRSIHYTADSVCVPEAYAHAAATASARPGGTLYTLGIAGFAVVCHSGWTCQATACTSNTRGPRPRISPRTR